MIIRTAKNHNFSIINNTVLEDVRLSWEAKGLAAYLLSKPDDWRINVEHLWHAAANGYQAVKRILRELEAHGYLVRKRTRGEKGKFVWEVVLHETPQPRPFCIKDAEHDLVPIGQKPSDGSPSDGFPSDGSPSDGFPSDGFPSDIVSTENQSLRPNTEKKETERERGTAPQAPSAEAGPPALTPQQELFGAVCEACGMDHHVLTKKDKGQVAQTVGILGKNGYRAEDVRRFMVEIWFQDWRWQKEGAYPTLAQLRQSIGRLRMAPPPATNGNVPRASPAQAWPTSNVERNVAAVRNAFRRLRSATDESTGADSE